MKERNSSVSCANENNHRTDEYFEVFCPHPECMARGKNGQGNILIHGRKRPRYRCKECGRTFSAQVETMFAGLRKPTDLIVIIATLLSMDVFSRRLCMRMGWMNGRWRVGGYIGIHRPKRRSSYILTDIATGWTEYLPLLHHDQDAVLLALNRASQLLPFPLLGLDTDNGGGFIKAALLAYCEREHVTFTS